MRSLILTTWEDGGWLLQDANRGTVLAKGRFGTGEVPEFSAASGAHWLGEGDAQTARRSTVVAAAGLLWSAAFDVTASGALRRLDALRELVKRGSS